MDTIDMACDVYQDSGTIRDKNPILLLHGLFWNKYMMRNLALALCRATHRKVFCPDLRCHDRSPFKEEFTSEIVAEDLKRLLRNKGLDKVAIVCHSFSCCPAYLLTLDEPERVEKMVMIDHGPFPDPTEKTFRDAVAPQVLAQNRLLEKLDPALSLSEAKRKIFKISEEATTIGQKVWLQKVAYELTKEKGEFKWKTDHRFLLDKYHRICRFVAPRGQLDHEILLVRAEQSFSKLVDFDFDPIKKHNPNAEMKILKGTTHLLMFEKQDEFVEIVEDFLS